MKIKYFESAEFVNEILQQSINQNLIKYSLFMKFISEFAPIEENRILAKNSYQKSKLIPSGALGAIFSDPSFCFWIYLSGCIQQRIENNEKIPFTDIPYLKNYTGDIENRIVEIHLLELNRFLLSASMLSRTEFKCELIVLDNSVFVPQYGISINIPGKRNRVQVELDFLESNSLNGIGEFEITNLDELLYTCEKGGIVESSNSNIQIESSIVGAGGKIVIDAIDPFITSGWSSIYKNPDGSAYKLLTENEFRFSYDEILQGYNEVKSVWPEMEFTLSTLIRTVHVINSPNPDRHMSCTSDQFFGSILMSRGNKFLIAEALVHEYSHNVLNMIIKSGEIFDGPPPMDEIYYSPWREDARHISGVFHAVFVFTNVSQLLEKLSQKYPTNVYLTERKLDNLFRLELGIEVLKEFNFSKSLAKILVEELNEEIDLLKSKYAEFDRSILIESQLGHLRKWVLMHSSLPLPQYLQGFI
jgi:hypothetical protein